ncbi:hypothetical protein, partial [Williamsia sp.]|uniref:hypothetical protein n=1 Tax=Williamsia sp. TaxID=1872085 RepID=UPI0025DA10CC
MDGTAVIRKPASPTGVDYRDYLSGDSLARFQQLDRIRSVDKCNYLDPTSVIRSYSAPLYVGPADGDLSSPADCDVQLDPTKNANKVGSIAVSTDGTLTADDTPDGKIGTVPYYGGPFDTVCSYGVVTPTGQYLTIIESLSGLTLAREANMGAVCKDTMALLVASLPRIMGTEPLTSSLPDARSVAARVDPCVALDAVLYDHPLANTQMEFPNPPMWTHRCSIGIDGDVSAQDRMIVEFVLAPAGSTYTGATETT